MDATELNIKRAAGATAAWWVAAPACVALAIGSIGPWKTSLSGSSLGIDGGGVYTLLIAFIALLLLIPRPPWPAIVAALGAVATAIAAVNVIEIAGSTREPIGLQAPSVEIDWGLWLTFLASIALAVSAGRIAWEPQAATLRHRQPGSRIESWIRAHPAIFGLAVLLVLGLILRVWLTAAWSPAFTGYSDSGIYFQGAFESVWSDPIRMVGYPMFLWLIHALAPHLIAVVIVQHAMGLVAAALMFFAVRRCGGPTWLGLFPAAVIAVGGDELFLEHAALSDALFVFLIVATLYATLRAAQDRAWWAAVAGICGGLAVWDRTVGFALLAVVSLWLVFHAGRPSRRSFGLAAVSLLTALAVVGIYAAWRSAETDMPGTLTSNNAWNLYGRVAPWADCDKFTPPAGTEGLCQKTPASQRGYHSGEEYIYSGESPAQILFGPPYEVSPDPKAMEKMQKWSEAAIKGQPLNYLNAVWLDAKRFLSPDSPSYGDLTANAFIAYVISGVNRNGRNEFVKYWEGQLYPHDPPPHHGSVGPFKTWEAITRIVNLWMVLLLVLCLATPWLLSGRARSGAILFGATALVLLLFPIVSKGYDYRFTIPAYAPLAAAGALAAWGLVVTITTQVQKRTLSPPWMRTERTPPEQPSGRIA